MTRHCAPTLLLPEPADEDRTVVTFGVAITTIGRWDGLGRVLDDLARQSKPPHTVAIAYEDHGDAAEGLRRALQGCADQLTIRTVVKSGGASNGRNAAVATFTDDVEWLFFPTDTSRLDPDFLERLSSYCVVPTTVCAMRLVDAEGNRNKLPARGSGLTRRNVWAAVMPAMAIRYRDFLRVGRFDPSIGTGADTPWQCGDETDLLLRLSMLDGFSIEWIDDIAVHVQTNFSHLTPTERRRKLRNYGRGTGYIYRRWNYSAWDKVRHLAGAASLPLRKRAKYRPRDGLTLLIGRTEGISGRKFSGNLDHRAILR
jgi:hypothetical protein